MLKKRLLHSIKICGFFLVSRFIAIDNKKIVFITTRGWYDCNPKYIAEEIIRKKLPYTLVWTVRKNAPLDAIPEEIIKVKRGSREFYKHLASAKIIIDNSVSLAYMGYVKKRKQLLIETWHGSIGIKKFSKETNKDKKWVRKATYEGKITDYCISNSTFETDLFVDTFWKNANILELGHARNDILFGHDADQIKKIKANVFKTFSLKEDSKICLYAPTFRDDNDMSPYNLDYAKLRTVLETKFGGSWFIFTRFHFNVLKKLKEYKLSTETIDASYYPDIQELLVCTDVGITDYSSWICDFLLTGRPGFLFATDMDEYQQKDREFFYPLKSMPFPLATSVEQLLENILSFDSQLFSSKCEEFLSDKGCVDDGHASERIMEFINNKVYGGETKWHGART